MHTNRSDKIELLIAEEEALQEKINTCEICVSAVLDAIVERQGDIHILTAEGILSSIHTISTDFQTELLHLKLEKIIVASSERASHQI